MATENYIEIFGSLDKNDLDFVTTLRGTLPCHFSFFLPGKNVSFILLVGKTHINMYETCTQQTAVYMLHQFSLYNTPNERWGVVPGSF